ncbi:MAG: DUF2442 domain-containing protein [Myxococcales bacterium]|nr:DUF2442 domain-containing protein [Myxococcales bacterium]
MSKPPVDRGPRATNVRVDGDTLTVDLADGEALEVPLDWFPGLVEASPKVLKNFEITDEGRRIEWKELGEEISLPGLLRGIAALGSAD